MIRLPIPEANEQFTSDKASTDRDLLVATHANAQHHKDKTRSTNNSDHSNPKPPRRYRSRGETLTVETAVMAEEEEEKEPAEGGGSGRTDLGSAANRVALRPWYLCMQSWGSPKGAGEPRAPTAAIDRGRRTAVRGDDPWSKATERRPPPAAGRVAMEVDE